MKETGLSMNDAFFIIFENKKRKIRRNSWDESSFIQFNKQGQIVDEKGNLTSLNESDCSATDWEYEHAKRDVKKDDDIYTVPDFVECCKTGLFINDDGIGYYSDGHFVYHELLVDCKDFVCGLYDKRFSHVVWYNK